MLKSVLLPIAVMTLAAAPAARASSVVIWPVDPTISENQKATAIWIENKGKERVTLQVRAFSWSQSAGENVLSQQADLVASPPMAEVEPGGRQLVRLVRRAEASDTPEAAYRLLIDELPAAPATDAETLQAQLRVQMRYSIPLFVYGSKQENVSPQLEARIVAAPSGPMLSIRNSGSRHARLSDLRGLSGGKEALIKSGLAGYVLPGSSIQIPLPPRSFDQFQVNVNGSDQTLAFQA
ncbi:fimbrial biogenesis chaperone [Novosphingopyxis iocasae]|uniref:fimbrial biogenesis chaperone n=1 Tax=Novosphingopyxis iocasae TaxID=2762729 RepID=UPI0016510842|nr:molecular chaperone [Novosphingopyxis iocasae]